jgi:hypothetical protein
MSRCEITSHIVTDAPPGADGWQSNTHGPAGYPQRIEYKCAIHNMPMGSPHLPGAELCPIGRIDEATEAALAKIAAARQ